MSTTRLTKHAGAAAFVLAATLGIGTATVLPAQSAAVAVVPAPTTTTVTVKSPIVAYGDTTTVSVTVDDATTGPKPTGKVTLTVGDKVLTADLTNGGRVDFDLPLLDASTTPYAITASFVPTDAGAYAPSTSAPVTVTVTKDETTSTVTARHSMRTNKIVATSFVTSAHGQVPSGEVRFVLRRNGVKVAATVASLNANVDPTRDFARAKFLNVRDTGVYKVIAKYRGSDNFLKSRGKFTIPS